MMEQRRDEKHPTNALRRRKSLHNKADADTPVGGVESIYRKRGGRQAAFCHDWTWAALRRSRPAAAGTRPENAKFPTQRPVSPRITPLRPELAYVPKTPQRITTRPQTIPIRLKSPVTMVTALESPNVV